MTSIEDETMRGERSRRRWVAASLVAIAVAIAFVAWSLRDRPPAATTDTVGSPSRQATTSIGAVEANAPAEGTLGADRTAADLGRIGDDAVASVTGAFVRADGTQIDRAQVSLVDPSTRERSAKVAAGRFEFVNVVPGHYLLTATVAGDPRLQREVDVTAPRTHVDLRLDPERIVTVKAVTPAGEPLVSVVRRASPRLFYGSCELWAAAFTAPVLRELPFPMKGVTGVMGQFRPRDPSDHVTRQPPEDVLGTLTTSADAPVTLALLLRRSVLAQQTVVVGQDSVTFTLMPEALLTKVATVRMRVVDERGAPIVGVRIALTGGVLGDPQMADTDKAGRCEVAVLPGRCRLYAFATKCAVPPVAIDIPAGATLDLGDLVGRGIVTVPLTPFGFLGSCTLVSRGLDAPPAGCAFVDSGGHSEKGLQLYPGRHAIVAKGAKQWAIAIVDTSALPPLPLRLEFRDTVPLRIQTTRADGLWQVEIRTAIGLPVHSLESGGARTFFVRMPQGSYEATVTDIDGRRTTRAFTLGPDGGVLTLD